MPINIPKSLPAYNTLLQENIFTMALSDAERQDIRPLRIIILNLMPKKIETETQLLRLLSNTPLQVDVEFMYVATHVSKNTPFTHLSAFYTTFAEITDKKYDGMIITGAPVEQLDYEKVDYWHELCEIMEWSRTHVYSTLHICWGAQAALYYHFGVPKYDLPEKMFGIFPHDIDKPSDPLLKGFDDGFMVPHSRHTELHRDDIDKHSELEVLASSADSGVYIVANKNGRQYFLTGHAEYDRFTIASEYFRDVDKGLDIKLPKNYFPENDPRRIPPFTWRCHANLMYSNWLNYCVYQKTPFDLNDIC